MKKKLSFALVGSLLVFSLAQPLAAQDWPQWRGANREGTFTGFRPRALWPEALKLKWKVAVGEGHASPVVAGNRVFLHSRRGDSECAAAFDITSGKEIWKDSYAVSYTMHPAATGHGKGPKSTPVVSDGKLFTLGITGILSSYDTKSGRLLWRKDFAGLHKLTSPQFGTAMSPVVENGVVIAHIGGHDDGALMAFDAKTGDVKWKWNGDGPGYASPIIVDLDGTRQIVTQSQQNIIGVALASGELLWKIPFKNEYQENIVTPLLYQKMLIFSGVDNGTLAVRVSKVSGQWKPETVWSNKQVEMYMNTPVLDGDLLFGLSHKNKGQYFCLDAKTGKTLWTSEGRQGENAVMLISGDTLLLLTNSAELMVAKKTATSFAPVKKYTVADSATWAHPAISGNRLLVKDAANLALWALE